MAEMRSVRTKFNKKLRMKLRTKQQISRYAVIVYGFKSHQPHQNAEKPHFRGFFVVIRGIFNNFLRINITINIK